MVLLWVTSGTVENSWTKTLQNLRCQVEVSFIVESFLKGKPKRKHILDTLNSRTSRVIVMQSQGLHLPWIAKFKLLLSIEHFMLNKRRKMNIWIYNLFSTEISEEISVFAPCSQKFDCTSSVWYKLICNKSKSN